MHDVASLVARLVHLRLAKRDSTMSVRTTNACYLGKDRRKLYSTFRYNNNNMCDQGGATYSRRLTTITAKLKIACNIHLQLREATCAQRSCNTCICSAHKLLIVVYSPLLTLVEGIILNASQSL